MPGDTKIKRTAKGWIDIDVPTLSYAARWQARQARKKRLANPLASIPSQVTRHYDPVAIPDGTVSRFSPRDSTQAPTFAGQPLTQYLSGLQQRLYDRLTQRQGVTAADAFDVVTSYGYNAAASYGHMREAGANHSEALAVIDLGSPDVSLAYGRRRATGYNHTWALNRALASINQDDDDGDD